MVYENWFGGGHLGGDKCAAMQRSTGRWVDFPCNGTVQGIGAASQALDTSFLLRNYTNMSYTVTVNRTLPIIRKVVYSSGSTRKTENKGVVDVLKNTPYRVRFEILRNDLDSASEKVTEVLVDDQDLGECNPDGGAYNCTFFDCSVTQKEVTVVSETGKINLNMKLTGHSHNCDCDTSTWNCSRENTVSGRTKMTAVGTFIFTPVEQQQAIVSTNYGVVYNRSASKVGNYNATEYEGPNTIGKLVHGGPVRRTQGASSAAKSKSFVCSKEMAWIEVDAHMFKVYGDRKTWQDAETHCQAQGGHLATFLTEKQTRFVAENYQSPGKGYWIGLRKGETEIGAGWAQDGSVLAQLAEGVEEVNATLAPGKQPSVKMPWKWVGTAQNDGSGDVGLQQLRSQVFGRKFNLNPSYDFSHLFKSAQAAAADPDYASDLSLGTGTGWLMIRIGPVLFQTGFRPLHSHCVNGFKQKNSGQQLRKWSPLSVDKPLVHVFAFLPQVARQFP